VYCPNCGGEFQTPAEGHCPHCGHDLGYAESPPPAPGPPLQEGPPGGGPGAPPPPPGEQPYCPFEDPALGFFDGLVETVKQVILRPAAFFRRMPDTSDIGRPFLFYLIFSVLGAFFQMAWKLVFLPFQDTAQQMEEIRQGLEQSGMGADHVDTLMNLMEVMTGAGGPIGGFIFAVVFNVILLFLVAGIVHLFLMLFGGANRGFGATFRVMAYTETLALCYIVPMCGVLIFLLWSLVLYIVGLAHAHRTDGWRAVLAVLALPILCVLCCCFGLIALVGIGSAAGAGGG